MSYYVWGSHLSYRDYLQAKSFAGDITSATRSAEHSVSMAISRQTRDIIASNETLSNEHIKAVEASTNILAGALNEGFERLSYGLNEISSGISELNATFHWGFGQMLAEMGHMNDALAELVKIAITPVQTIAFNHFEIARDAFRQGLYQESLDELEKAISGDHTSAGYKLEWRFHQLKGTLLLGFAECDISLVDPAKAEESFLLAARYGKTDYPEDAGRAFLSAGWAAYCQGKLKEALTYTEQAMEIYPALGEAFFQASKVRIAMGDVDNALPILSKAIDLDRFFALKAAGDGDFQKYDKSLQAFLETMRCEKYRLSVPRVQAVIKEFQFWIDHEPSHILLDPLRDFIAKGESWPLMDMLRVAGSLNERIATIKQAAQEARILVCAKKPLTVQEEVIVKPAGFFRKAVTKAQMRTHLVDDPSYYNGLGLKIPPRFDGIYKATDDNQYLRYYADGTVITVSSDGRPEEVFPWFRREDNSLGRGNYTLDGCRISFTSRGDGAVVDYEGTIADARIHLNSYSHDTDYRDSRTYQFIQLPPT